MRLKVSKMENLFKPGSKSTIGAGARRAARWPLPLHQTRCHASPPRRFAGVRGRARMGPSMYFNRTPRLTGVALSPSPRRAPGARGTGTTPANRGRSSPWAEASSGEHLARSPGSGGRCKEKAPRKQPARVGGLEQRRLGRRRVPSSRSILRSFTIKNKAGRFSKPNTGLDRLQQEVDDLVCATHALKIIIKRVKNEK